MPTLSSVPFFILLYFHRGVFIFLTSDFRQSTKSPVKKRECEDLVVESTVYGSVSEFDIAETRVVYMRCLE